MKKISVVLIAILSIILAACATPAGAATQVDSTQAAGGAVPSNSNTPLPLASQLALGTLNLKTTSFPVSVDQATTLLPLWEGLRSLSQSTTFSQLEYDALVKQIQDSMSPDQMNAISGMKLTQADTGRIMQELGLANGFGRGASNNGTPIARTPGARPGGTDGGGRGGGFGGGGFAGGGGFGGFPGGGGRQSQNGAAPSIQATIVARQAQRANQANPFLESAVVIFLQQLTGATPNTNATPTPGAVTTN